MKAKHTFVQNISSIWENCMSRPFLAFLHSVIRNKGFTLFCVFVFCNKVDMYYLSKVQNSEFKLEIFTDKINKKKKKTKS